MYREAAYNAAPKRGLVKVTSPSHLCCYPPLEQIAINFVQLRQLEERLLDTISAVEGTILDDDTVVKALEDLKGEAGDVAKEVRTRSTVVPPLFCVLFGRL